MTGCAIWNTVHCHSPPPFHLCAWAFYSWKRELTSVKPESDWSLLSTGGCKNSTHELSSLHACTKMHFWISMGLVKGLAVTSFQIVNYTKRQPCCSLNVISQFDKWYLGNMTGMTFSDYNLQCTKSTHSLRLSKEYITHTHSYTKLFLFRRTCH